MTLQRMPHYGITVGKEVASDIHCHIIMGNDVAMCTYHGITMYNDVAMNLFYCAISVLCLITLRKDFVILQLYWWLFSSTKHFGGNIV